MPAIHFRTAGSSERECCQEDYVVCLLLARYCLAEVASTWGRGIEAKEEQWLRQKLSEKSLPLGLAAAHSLFVSICFRN